MRSSSLSWGRRSIGTRAFSSLVVSALICFCISFTSLFLPYPLRGKTLCRSQAGQDYFREGSISLYSGGLAAIIKNQCNRIPAIVSPFCSDPLSPCNHRIYRTGVLLFAASLSPTLTSCEASGLWKKRLQNKTRAVGRILLLIGSQDSSDRGRLSRLPILPLPYPVRGFPLPQTFTKIC